jgi:hypothetical protein
MELSGQCRIGADCLLVAREKTIVESELQRPRAQFRLLTLIPN